jgi:hypothetical protein
MPELPLASALDGALHCRVDSTTGKKIAVVPARCRAGLHRLDPTVSPVVATSDHLSVTCPRCDPAAGQGTTWLLTISGARPASAELDDAPYLGRYGTTSTGR